MLLSWPQKMPAVSLSSWCQSTASAAGDDERLLMKSYIVTGLHGLFHVGPSLMTVSVVLSLNYWRLVTAPTETALRSLLWASATMRWADGVGIRLIVLTHWRPLLRYGYRWASECPDVKNYKWRLNPIWHRMLYSCTHLATVGVKWLNFCYVCVSFHIQRW